MYVCALYVLKKVWKDHQIHTIPGHTPWETSVQMMSHIQLPIVSSKAISLTN